MVFYNSMGGVFSIGLSWIIFYNVVCSLVEVEAYCTCGDAGET